ncbi:MAG: tetratricopeptide repeat protein [Candidatus Melainabacteria bacterium]|nr:tetratricopeptide repeat protein [Candidatus Melainabacteria bacterium]
MSTTPFGPASRGGPRYPSIWPASANAATAVVGYPATLNPATLNPVTLNPIARPYAASFNTHEWTFQSSNAASTPGAATTAGATPSPWTLNNPTTLRLLQAQKHKEQGNRYYQLKHYDFAIAAYLQAIDAFPYYTDAYYNMAKVYIATGDDQRAIASFDRLLQLAPQDHEARVLMAERMQRLGWLQPAKDQYHVILQHKPHFDPAYRNARLLDHQLLALTNPAAAEQAFQQTSQENLRQAERMVRQYLQKTQQFETLDWLGKIPCEFAATQVVLGITNMAEYDNRLGPYGVIRLSPELAYAHPNVLGAYLVHELVHAADQDGISSVLEEQDAYREQTRFWLMYKRLWPHQLTENHAENNIVPFWRQSVGLTSNGQPNPQAVQYWKTPWIEVSDPNLDLAAQLYEQSVDVLDQKVRDVYAGRDPLLPERSPGHGMARKADDPSVLEAYQLDKQVSAARYNVDRLKSLLPVYGLQPPASVL